MISRWMFQTGRSRAPLIVGLIGACSAACLATSVARAQAGGSEGEGETRPNAQTAMSGGGMTEGRQLDDARARDHFLIATRYYDEGRFAEAAAQFEEAYDLSRRPELLYNAYIAFRDAHNSSGAARMLELYLSRVPDAPDRVNLEARLTQLRRAIEEEERSQRDLESATANAMAERARAEEEARRRAEAEAQPEVWPWVIFGVGAAAAIAGGIVGGVALADTNALLDDCTDGRCRMDQANLDEARDGAKGIALAADLLMFGGGAVAVTGLILGLIFGLPRTPEAESADAAAAEAVLDCGPLYCGGRVQGRF
ncbi:MAG: hypothetical protein AB7S26_23020 [Sandaracinaceae bacterium]